MISIIIVIKYGMEEQAYMYSSFLDAKLGHFPTNFQ